MSSALSLRPHLPFPISLPSANRLFPKPFFSSAIASNLTLNLEDSNPNPLHLYGPSLRRGHNPPPPSTSSFDEEEGAIDRASFTRSFDVAALRVPAEDCSALESRLRGHLLNWPRVRNVARVPGDDVDPDFKKMLRGSPMDGGDRLDSLARRSDGEEEVRVLPPVLYRERLVRDFNCRGFVRFRNLAKISRPKKKKKKEDGFEVKEREGKNGVYVIEVVGNGSDGEEEDDLSGLLGNGFRRGRWRGPTRLLLLDERYARKGMEELPQAVKVALILCELR